MTRPSAISGSRAGLGRRRLGLAVALAAATVTVVGLTRVSIDAGVESFVPASDWRRL